jgi:hypothetical protein
MDNQRLSLSLGDPVADYYNRISLGQPVPERPQQPVVEAAPQVESRRAVVEEKQPAALLPEEEHTQQMEDRMRRRAEAMAYINNQVISLPKDMRDITFRSMREYLDMKYPEMKSFNEQPAAKFIMSELPAMDKKDDMIRNIRGELEAASKVTDKKEKMARLRTIIPKLIQSTGTGGADALQPAEVILGAPESQTFFTWAAATNRDISSPATWLAFFNDPAVQGSQIFEADPDKYIKKAKGVYNTFVQTRNERIDRYREMSSERWLKTNTGLKAFSKFDDADTAAEAAAKQPVSPATATFDVKNGRIVRKEALPSQTQQSVPSAVQVPVPTQAPEPAQAPAKKIKFVLRDGKLVPE